MRRGDEREVADGAGRGQLRGARRAARARVRRRAPRGRAAPCGHADGEGLRRRRDALLRPRALEPGPVPARTSRPERLARAPLPISESGRCPHPSHAQEGPTLWWCEPKLEQVAAGKEARSGKHRPSSSALFTRFAMHAFQHCAWAGRTGLGIGPAAPGRAKQGARRRRRASAPSESHVSKRAMAASSTVTLYGAQRAASSPRSAGL